MSVSGRFTMFVASAKRPRVAAPNCADKKIEGNWIDTDSTNDDGTRNFGNFW